MDSRWTRIDAKTHWRETPTKNPLEIKGLWGTSGGTRTPDRRFWRVRGPVIFGVLGRSSPCHLVSPVFAQNCPRIAHAGRVLMDAHRRRRAPSPRASPVAYGPVLCF